MEDTAGTFKRLKFDGVAIHTKVEGRISELHVGLKGTMNLRAALQAETQAASLAREILRGMIEEIRVEPTPGKESRIDCPWDLTIRGPLQAVLEMPDMPDFAKQMAPAAISPFARRGLMVPLA